MRFPAFLQLCAVWHKVNPQDYLQMYFMSVQQFWATHKHKKQETVTQLHGVQRNEEMESSTLQFWSGLRSERFQPFLPFVFMVPDGTNLICYAFKPFCEVHSFRPSDIFKYMSGRLQCAWQGLNGKKPVTFTPSETVPFNFPSLLQSGNPSPCSPPSLGEMKQQEGEKTADV